MTNPDIPKSEQVMTFTHLGYDCTVLMGLASINGYVELPEGHPWLDLENLDFVNVHGGVTYRKGRVVGFDTSHICDGYHQESEVYKYLAERGGRVPNGRVWSWEEVIEETKYLAWLANGAEKETL